MELNTVAVINSPRESFNPNNSSTYKIGKDERIRYLHLLPIYDPLQNIRLCKNTASRVATRAHGFFQKKKWKRNIDHAIEKGYEDYYRAEGKNYFEDYTLELIIMDKFWTDI